uniref:Uncharacterized protein n=1 Tax=Chromera velia CCMP2878 TaxID=1169474 RepID=A0A0G4HM67_9ALVE|eukprot:Cvel_1164.t1-p1 / transcript=Cvel_1164.t1 / gene=Cvel_1164 / organism=Chromera_velia_CCMP2878 / gene_product=hypothetical protein / transcript_product=hypothetical protein / location=Cvel_scaffold38:137731-142138(+) / protein_length=200 / sequence_SO=supercontig / SO=protein_coding / is_pseudo=false
MASRASDSRDIKPTSFRVMGSKGMVYFTPKAARFRYDEQRDTWEAVREPAGVFVEFFRRCGNRFERFSSSPFFLGGRDLGSVLAATGDENRSVDFLSRDEKRKFSVGFNSEDAIKPVSLRLELFPGTPDGQTKDTEAAEEATGGKGDRDSPATASDLEVAMRRSELLHLQGFLREILPAVYGWQVLEDPRRVVAFASNPD